MMTVQRMFVFDLFNGVRLCEVSFEIGVGLAIFNFCTLPGSG